jgi:ABC-2 type transport system permease protein
MNHTRQALLVAGWEFNRYFKWRDQVLGLVLFLVLSGVGFGVGRLANTGGREITVAVEGMDPATLGALSSDARLRFVTAPDGAARAASLADESLAGVLTRNQDGSFTLLVEKDPRYRAGLATILDNIVRRERLAREGMTDADLSRLLLPAQLDVRFTDAERDRTGRGETVIAFVATGIVILAIFTSMAYLLTGITGEKQLRVTESLVSFVSPQAWIDGKILGIGAYALVNIANIAVGSVLLLLVANVGWGLDLPRAVARPGILLLLFLFCVLALALWNSVFAAFAATLDDPNTSTRTSLMFVPMLFVGLACWVVLRDPDSTLARVLAIFPLTSASALPIRAILSDVGAPETIVAAVLLIGTIWFVRRAAGRIFEIGILMYGKEPSFAEIARWARGA